MSTRAAQLRAALPALAIRSRPGAATRARRARVVLCEEHRSIDLRAERIEERLPELAGDRRELVSRGSGRLDVTGRHHDLGVGAEHPRPGHRILGLEQHPADRRVGVVDPSLREAEQSETRLRIASRLVGQTVRVLGVGELAPKPVELAAQVERAAENKLAPRVGEPVTCALHLVQRVGPGATQLHDLGSMDQALAAVQHELGLCITPAAECSRPLVRPTNVEQLLARLDHGAVRVADRDRRDLSRSHAHHRLVEQGDALFDLAHVDQAPTLPDASEGGELRFAKELAHRGRLAEARMCSVELA